MPDKINYRKNFLSEVIARLDFASPLQRLSKELPTQVSMAALKVFPIQEPRKTIAKQLQISPQKVASHDVEITEWNFYGKEREKRLVFVSQSLFVAYNRYQNYESFRSDFLYVLDAFFKDFADAVPNRLGLRYINNLDLPNGNPFAWSDYINGNLLSVLSFAADKTKISRAFSNLEFNHGDFNVRFQFGMHNPDYPAAIKRRHFVLDFDAYHQGLQNPQEIATNLDRYHDTIESLFEASITEAFRGILNG